MTDYDILTYCEKCDEVTPHTVSGSGKKKFCQECEPEPQRSVVCYLYEGDVCYTNVDNFDKKLLKEKSFRLIAPSDIEVVIETMKKKFNLKKITFENWLYIAKVYNFDVVKELM